MILSLSIIDCRFSFGFDLFHVFFFRFHFDAMSFLYFH